MLHRLSAHFCAQTFHQSIRPDQVKDSRHTRHPVDKRCPRPVSWTACPLSTTHSSGLAAASPAALPSRRAVVVPVVAAESPPGPV